MHTSGDLFIRSGATLPDKPLWYTGCNRDSVIFKLILCIYILRIACKWWMPQNTFNDNSTLVQVMAWCFHFFQQFVQANIKENVKAPYDWPFVSGTRQRIPLTKGLEMRKVFS